MVHILRIKDPQWYPPYCWDTLGVLSTRRDLLETGSIFSHEITKLDAFLIKQSDVPLHELVRIWARAQYIFLDVYLDPDIDNEIKHRVLLHMKAHYEEYRRMPQRVQDLLAPMWGSWHSALLIEMEEERSCVIALRKEV